MELTICAGTDAAAAAEDAVATSQLLRLYGFINHVRQFAYIVTRNRVRTKSKFSQFQRHQYHL